MAKDGAAPNIFAVTFAFVGVVCITIRYIPDAILFALLDHGIEAEVVDEKLIKPTLIVAGIKQLV